MHIVKKCSVTKNKTQHRVSLSTDMRSSLVTHKVVMSAIQEVSHSQQIDDGLLRKAKSAIYKVTGLDNALVQKRIDRAWEGERFD